MSQSHQNFVICHRKPSGQFIKQKLFGLSLWNTLYVYTIRETQSVDNDINNDFVNYFIEELKKKRKI